MTSCYLNGLDHLSLRPPHNWYDLRWSMDRSCVISVMKCRPTIHHLLMLLGGLHHTIIIKSILRTSSLRLSKFIICFFFFSFHSTFFKHLELKSWLFRLSIFFLKFFFQLFILIDWSHAMKINVLDWININIF